MKSTNTAILAAAFLGLASASGETPQETSLRGRELFVCGDHGSLGWCEREGRWWNYYEPCCECEQFYTGTWCDQCIEGKSPSGCDNKCGSTKVVDECGVCGGSAPPAPNQQPILPLSQLKGKEYDCDQVVDSEGNYQGPLILGAKDAEGGNLPPNLQGIFWLTDQGDSSAIVSFGAPGQSMDGGVLNPGYLTDQCETSISVRVGGDRNWAFHSQGSSWELVEGVDLVYQFQFDNIQDPQRCTIIPTGYNLGGFEVPTWALRFDMNLIPDRCHSDAADSVKRQCLEDGYEIKPGSWQGIPAWSRPSYIFGQEAESARYQLVQVVDGEGKATAAMPQWVDYCQSAETGDTPNKIYYRSAI